MSVMAISPAAGDTGRCYVIPVKIVIELLVAVPVFLLWLMVITLIVRPFGIRMPLQPFNFGERRKVLQSLTFPKYVAIYGVLCFGGGMVIMTILSRFLDWKFFHGSASHLT